MHIDGWRFGRYFPRRHIFNAGICFRTFRSRPVREGSGLYNRCTPSRAKAFAYALGKPGTPTKTLRRRPPFPVDLKSISTMHAMILEKPGTALREIEVPAPSPSVGQVKVRVRACAVCRTDLHVVDGELPHPKLPLIPGHEIVGEIV